MTQETGIKDNIRNETVRQAKIKPDQTRHNKIRHDEIRPGKTRQEKAEQGKTKYDKENKQLSPEEEIEKLKDKLTRTFAEMENQRRKIGRASCRERV